MNEKDGMNHGMLYLLTNTALWLIWPTQSPSHMANENSNVRDILVVIIIYLEINYNESNKVWIDAAVEMPK